MSGAGKIIKVCTHIIIGIAVAASLLYAAYSFILTKMISACFPGFI